MKLVTVASSFFTKVTAWTWVIFEFAFAIVFEMERGAAAHLGFDLDGQEHLLFWHHSFLFHERALAVSRMCRHPKLGEVG